MINRPRARKLPVGLVLSLSIWAAWCEVPAEAESGNHPEDEAEHISASAGD
jgi:hypothetical protein